MRLVLKVLLFFVMLILVPMVVITGFILLLGDIGLPDEILMLLLMAISFASLFTVYWFFFGRGQWNAYKQRKSLEQEAFKRMMVPDPPPRDQTLSDSGRDNVFPPLLEIHLHYTEQDVERATVFLSSVFLQMKGHRPVYIMTIIYGAIGIASVWGAFYMPELWHLTRMVVLVGAVFAGSHLLGIWTAKRQTRKNPQSGEMFFQFYNHYFAYQITSQTAKMELQVSYKDMKQIYRTKNMLYLFTKGKKFFIPTGREYNEQQLEEFLQLYFPSLYKTAYAKAPDCPALFCILNVIQSEARIC